MRITLKLLGPYAEVAIISIIISQHVHWAIQN